MQNRVWLIVVLAAALAACGSAPAAPSPAAPATPADAGEDAVRLTWHREGGIAGFCDVLTATTTGEAHAGRCNAEAATAQLTPEERLKLQTWAITYGPLVIVIGDPAVADSLLTSLEMNGRGTAQPTEAEQQAMFDWAQTVYNRLAQP